MNVSLRWTCMQQPVPEAMVSGIFFIFFGIHASGYVLKDCRRTGDTLTSTPSNSPA